MKVAVINGLLKKENIARTMLSNIIREMDRADLRCENFDLSSYDIPYYEKEESQRVDEVISKVSDTDAVLLVSSVHLHTITAYLNNFLHYLELEPYKKAFKGKVVIPILFYENDDEMLAYNIILSNIKILGMIELSRISISTKNLDVEKVKQYIKQIKFKLEELKAAISPVIINESSVARPQVKTKTLKEQLKLSGFENEKESDIEEITTMITKRLRTDDFESKNPYSGEKMINNLSSEYLENLEKMGEKDREEIDERIHEVSKYEFASFNHVKDVVPYEKVGDKLNEIRSRAYGAVEVIEEPEEEVPLIGLREKTKNLQYLFSPDFSDVLNMSVQINVSGEEEFRNYITIVDNHCNIEEGIDLASNITIDTSSDKWEKIVEGEISLKNAFMTGIIKVVGNFILLSKLDKAIFSNIKSF